MAVNDVPVELEVRARGHIDDAGGEMSPRTWAFWFEVHLNRCRWEEIRQGRGPVTFRPPDAM